MLGSYHNHPGYCDGSGTVEAYVAAAQAAGLSAVGLSSHAPVPFPCSWTMTEERFHAYLAEVRGVREAWRDRFPVWLGVELDYLDPALVPAGAQYQAERVVSAGLDYAVVSLHFVDRDPEGRPWAVDESADSFARQLEVVYGGNIQKLIGRYYRSLAQLAEWASRLPFPVVIGHLDKVKQWNVGERYFRETSAWYRQAVEEALQVIARAGVPIEVNTAGLRREIGATYPGEWILRSAHQLGIAVTIGADAHRPEDVAAGFEEAIALLRGVGYREVLVLAPGQWARNPLPER